MPLVDIDTVHPRVRMRVPNVPAEIMLEATRDALIALCQRSMVWREGVGPIPVFEDLSDYELDIPAHSSLVAVNHVYWDGKPLEFASISDIKKTGEDKTKPAQNRPNGWTIPSFGVVQLLPAPDADHADVFTAFCSLAPAYDATQVPDWLLRFREGIAEGAAHRLMTMPGTPWYAPTHAEALWWRFEDTVGEATRLALTDFTGVNRPVVDINYMPEV